ncbi:MAG: hypothetical protein Q8R47_01555 [Nanoarchaeota archaeon]|nr:hypothetical protein [Nanoarchaeota archaeon]
MKKLEEKIFDEEFNKEFSLSILLPIYGDLKFWHVTEKLERVIDKDGHSLSVWKWPARGSFYSFKYASIAFMADMVYDIVNFLY